MTVTIEKAANFAGADPEEELFADFFVASQVIIDDYLGVNGVFRCPEETYDLALLFVVRRVWDIHKSKNGMIQYGPDGEISTLPADVMKPAEPLLRRYKSLGAVG